MRSRRVCPGNWRWLLSGALLCGLGACGNEEIDQDDELGLEQDGDEERYELVIVEAPGTEQAEETIQETEASSSSLVLYNPEGDFTVQIGVYADARTARNMVRKLSGEGYPAYAVPNPDKKGVRVRIGYFKTRADARRFGTLFKQDKSMDFWIDRRANEKF